MSLYEWMRLWSVSERSNYMWYDSICADAEKGAAILDRFLLSPGQLHESNCISEQTGVDSRIFQTHNQHYSCSFSGKDPQYMHTYTARS